jgi:ATP-dependent DNA ligase
MSDQTAEASTDPRTWRPMRAYRGQRTFEIADPILEPLWSGARVIAHVAAPSTPRATPDVALIEELGVDVAPELPELAAAVGRAVMAGDAILDGVISRQVGLEGIGAAPIPEMSDRPGLVRNRVDLDVQARGADIQLEAAEDGFVAVDLLRVDGTSLLDVPLLERKRLLESVVRPDARVVVSVHVRPPIETWVATWKSIGLRGGILKAANSRYAPGEDSVEWRTVEMVARRSG